MRAVTACLFLLGVCMPTVAQEALGPWQVRRARTSDADKAGHYPTWEVSLSGDPAEAGLDVDIDEDPEAENARGHIFILKKVTVPEKDSLTLGFSYATFCANDNRCGMVDLVAMTPEQFEALGAGPETECVFEKGDREQVAVVFSAHSYLGDDVPEPVGVSEQARTAFAHQLLRFRGREMYVGVAWGGLHTTEEWCKLRDLRITIEEWVPLVKLFFDRLNLDYPGLEEAKAAWQAQDEERACAEVVKYYQERQEPRYPYAPARGEEHTVSARQLEEADMALENNFVGQGSYGFIHVPEPIDWSFNPVGDREWPWQFNRHSAWRALAAAYLATGEAKYAEKWVALLGDWIADNPPGTSWSWRTLETGGRIGTWLTVYVSFIDAPQFTPQDQVAMLNSLADHAEYLMPQGRFHSGSNWGLAESRGLLTAGLFLPEFKNAQSWKDTAWTRILGEIDAQVYPDGAQVELTPSYHGGVARSFLSIAQMVKEAGLEVPETYMQRVEKMHEYLMYLSKPDGTVPMLGDAWPGSVGGYLRTGRDFFGREDMRWLLSEGAEGVPPAEVSHSFPYASYHIMRSAWLDRDARWLLFDTAPWGGGHQQPDNLQVIVYAYGATLLPDSGSYLYYGEGRAEHARTSSHSTLSVDEANQDRSPGHLECWHSEELLDYADGWHQGYPEITSRRRVLFVKRAGLKTGPSYWALLDTVSGEGEHTVDQHFQCAPGELTIDDNTATAITKAGPGLTMLPLRLEGAQMEKIEGWVSYAYTKRERRPVLRIRRQGPLPASYVTLLLPFRDEPLRMQARELALADPSASAAAIEVAFEDHTDYLLMADEQRQFEVPEVSLSATCRAGMLRVDANGQPLACALVEGEGLTLAGRPVEAKP